MEQPANAPVAIVPPREREQIDWLPMVPFWSVHIGAVVGVILLGWSWSGLLLALALYAIRMFGLTAGYHRYFAHRSYKTSRVFQYLLAWLGCSAMQKGPLWWTAHHRQHHLHSDTAEDPHSPLRNNFWWSHIGWILVSSYEQT